MGQVLSFAVLYFRSFLGKKNQTSKPAPWAGLLSPQTRLGFALCSRFLFQIIIKWFLNLLAKATLALRVLLVDCLLLQTCLEEEFMWSCGPDYWIISAAMGYYSFFVSCHCLMFPKQLQPCCNPQDKDLFDIQFKICTRWWKHSPQHSF